MALSKKSVNSEEGKTLLAVFYQPFAIFSGFNKMKLHVKANDRNSILKYNLVKPLNAATSLIFINGKKNRQATYMI